MHRFSALLVILVLAACGGGGGGTPAAPLTVTVQTAATLSGAATITYVLGGTADVVVSYSTDGGTTWAGAAPAPGCPSNKTRPAGTHTYLWDTVADQAAGTVKIRVAAGGTTAVTTASVANAAPTWLSRSATIDASTVALTYPAVHSGHYDLSPVVQGYHQDATFAPHCVSMGVKSWRISVGRWEIGPVSIFAPEAAAYSTDVNALKGCSREFYRGPSTLAGAADPANYHFGYLDAAIAAAEAAGAKPYLCFDYMPFTLALNQDPNTAKNLYLSDASMSFSNGIRTSPPADNAVYAQVVMRTMMHVNGSFANGLNRSITHVEIGNEPELDFFYTGTRAQFNATYSAVSAALAAQFGSTIRIGGGSFAFLQGSTFMGDFLANLGGARLDFLSFHAYSDDVENYFTERILAAKALRDAHAPTAVLHCAEWSMALDGNGPKFGTMAAGLHHAKVLEYFALLGVTLSHRAVLRDPVADNLGDITLAPAQLKPTGAVFAAYELFGRTPDMLSIPSISPAGKPMLLAGRSADAVTLMFFHEKPPTGQVGRISLSLSDPGFGGTYAVDRWVLTGATCANHDGLWHTGTTSASGAYATTIAFTEDTLVLLRLAPTPYAPAAAN